jgi:hypothetical protein
LDAAETAMDGGAILIVTEGVHGGADEAVSVVVGTDGGADVGMSVDVGLRMDGGADTLVAYASVDEVFKGIADLSYSLDVLANFISFLTFLSFPVDNDIEINISSFRMMSWISYGIINSFLQYLFVFSLMPIVPLPLKSTVDPGNHLTCQRNLYLMQRLLRDQMQMHGEQPWNVRSKA